MIVYDKPVPRHEFQLKQERVRVLIADDHQIAREGLKRIMAMDGAIEIVGEAINGVQAVMLTRSLLPDIVIMDVRMPELDGIGATKQIKENHSNIKIMMFSLFINEFLHDALEAGASGFILKDSDAESIIEAVHQTNSGGFPISPTIIQHIISDFPALLVNQNTTALTNRQLEILKLMSEGYCSKDIATQIFTSQSTTKREIRQILQVLEARDRAQAVSKAVQWELI
ncbi:MAG: response regulator transcription factor [Dehalogenimonas sp.]|uniref:Response regulator transcription factor n=1 Tax=Candidatus Dehalogenimonas loeffleri TaxID=3127115 RepID=A0ABZ2J3P1_9CHLR|nr:response regulator transcription factor [Dehalogenimonas sp.]